MMDTNKSQSFLKDSRSSTYLSGCCRYNLRNRGPPMFTVLVEKECPICLTDVFEKPVVVNCGHTFCEQCIRLSMTKHKNCPLCNQVLIEQLFLSDSSFTKTLIRKNRSPVRAKEQSSGIVGKHSAKLPINTRSSQKSQPLIRSSHHGPFNGVT